MEKKKEEEEDSIAKVSAYLEYERDKYQHRIHCSDPSCCHIPFQRTGPSRPPEYPFPSLSPPISSVFQGNLSSCATLPHSSHRLLCEISWRCRPGKDGRERLRTNERNEMIIDFNLVPGLSHLLASHCSRFFKIHPN